jgi:ABC-type nickel/cobalt efflux system permease component RcnA
VGRTVILTVAIAVVLLLASVLISTATPKSLLAALLVIASGILLTGVVWVIFISAWQTKGWSLRHPGREEEIDPDPPDRPPG